MGYVFQKSPIFVSRPKFCVEIKQTRKSPCGKPQEAYCLRRKLSEDNLSWQGTPVLVGGYPSPDVGRPHPVLGGRFHPDLGVTHSGWGYPIFSWPGGTLLWGTPWKGPGTSHWGTPHKGHWDQWNYYGMEMGYPPEKTWDQWKYYRMEMGYTLPSPG